MVHVVSLIRSHRVWKIMCAQKSIHGRIMRVLRLTNQGMYNIVAVEMKLSLCAVKYLFKYITKGVDRSSAVIEKGNPATTSDTVASGEPKERVMKQQNEIQDYIDARYLSASESICITMWRNFAFHIHKRKPSVEKLIIHLEGEHNITIKATDNLGCVIRKLGIEKTMFTE
ncbi:unnamed protein product [Brassica oleracea var. botrytis]